MKYYFYNSTGKVTSIWYTVPPYEVLEKKHIISDKVFEIKQGFYNNLYVNLETLELSCEYIEIPKTINEEIDLLKGEMSVTQAAVDFLLMSSVSGVKIKNLQGGNDMGAYFAMRIMKGMLKYEEVVRKYPEYKADIDFILKSEGKGHLIVEIL